MFHCCDAEESKGFRGNGCAGFLGKIEGLDHIPFTAVRSSRLDETTKSFYFSY